MSECESVGDKGRLWKKRWGSTAEFTYDSADRGRDECLPRGMNEIISRGCVRGLARLGYRRQQGWMDGENGPPRSQANSQIYIMGGAGSALPSAPCPLLATQIPPTRRPSSRSHQKLGIHSPYTVCCSLHQRCSDRQPRISDCHNTYTWGLLHMIYAAQCIFQIDVRLYN